MVFVYSQKSIELLFYMIRMNKLKERRTPKYPDVNRKQPLYTNARELKVVF